MQDFKHIRAWQRAHALSIALHKLVDTFSGHAHLKSQLTRAVGSIASNIVEGCGADTNKEFARFSTCRSNRQTKRSRFAR